jgi:PRTRC genetic system protein C
MLPLIATAVTRVFRYSSRVLPDPDPALTPEQVKAFYANIHPELLNAQVEGGEFEGDVQAFVFQRAVGTKG